VFDLLLLIGFVARVEAQEIPERLPVTEEVVVWGEHHVRQARSTIVRAMEDRGWRALEKRRGDRVVFRPPEPWMGKAFLSVDGRLDFGRPVFAAEPTLVAGAYGDYNPDEVMDRRDGNGIAAGPSIVLLPSELKLKTLHERVRNSLKVELGAYRSVFEETQYQTLLAEIPQRLDALWDTGAALDGGEQGVQSEADRRIAVLAYWADQAESSGGDVVSEVIEAWIRQTIQMSDRPLTVVEIEAAQAARYDGRLLNLSQP
jgi:hypothetical protein